jgi:hypothetical protein
MTNYNDEKLATRTIVENYRKEGEDAVTYVKCGSDSKDLSNDELDALINFKL